MGKEQNAGPDYQEILKELEKKHREIENLQKALGEFVIKILKKGEILQKYDFCLTCSIKNLSFCIRFQKKS